MARLLESFSLKQELEATVIRIEEAIKQRAKMVIRSSENYSRRIAVSLC
ncbi:hypothetical protein KHA80_21090 [Anaerobacillus sp. HL2]|nr:hypothetical protein KHA80_21090 [Anaerobacillus sp. HL2]